MTRIQRVLVLMLVLLVFLAIVACNMGRYMPTCCKLNDDGTTSDKCSKTWRDSCSCPAGSVLITCVDTLDGTARP